MRVFRTSRHESHAPRRFIARGEVVASPERPERAAILEAAARGAGHELVEAGEHGPDPVARVHDAGYLAFLEGAWDAWQQLPGAGDEVIPNIHPGRNMAAAPRHPVSRAGHYQADTACPIGAGTWAGVRASADVAVSAAHWLMDETGGGAAPFAYALCRPPGHHAYADQAGGFCFLNNSAIAAQVCRDRGAARVAILDVDVHHGNGTQGIFWRRGDVLTVSLHGDPADYYPFFAGHADERGEGPGLGANLNLPLPRGTGDDGFLAALDRAAAGIAAFAPEVLVVALGLDASEHDPLAYLAVTTDGFRRIGRRLAGIGLPTVLVQEGGYVSPHLGANLAAALQGFDEARR